MKPEATASPRKSALAHMVLLIPFLLASGCGVLEEDSADMASLTDQLTTRFTRNVVDMAMPTDTVGLDAFTGEAHLLQVYFMDLDKHLKITRYWPDFDPADTLRITEQGDTLRSHNWALVYSFHLTKHVPFYDVKKALKNESMVEWVAPPVQVSLP